MIAGAHGLHKRTQALLAQVHDGRSVLLDGVLLSTVPPHIKLGVRSGSLVLRLTGIVRLVAKSALKNLQNRSPRR